MATDSPSVATVDLREHRVSSRGEVVTTTGDERDDHSVEAPAHILTSGEVEEGFESAEADSPSADGAEGFQGGFSGDRAEKDSSGVVAARPSGDRGEERGQENDQHSGGQEEQQGGAAPVRGKPSAVPRATKSSPNVTTPSLQKTAKLVSNLTRATKSPKNPGGSAATGSSSHLDEAPAGPRPITPGPESVVFRDPLLRSQTRGEREVVTELVCRFHLGVRFPPEHSARTSKELQQRLEWALGVHAYAPPKLFYFAGNSPGNRRTSQLETFHAYEKALSEIPRQEIKVVFVGPRRSSAADCVMAVPRRKRT